MAESCLSGVWRSQPCSDIEVGVSEILYGVGGSASASGDPTLRARSGSTGNAGRRSKENGVPLRIDFANRPARMPPLRDSRPWSHPRGRLVLRLELLIRYSDKQFILVDGSRKSTDTGGLRELTRMMLPRVTFENGPADWPLSTATAPFEDDFSPPPVQPNSIDLSRDRLADSTSP